MSEYPERPLECTECKRKIACTYTEVVGEVTYRLSMCKECPVLEQKLKGSERSGEATELISGKGKAGVCCGNCGTTMEAVRMGQPLGCPQCYKVFEDMIIDDLIRQEAVPGKKGSARHKGRSPGEVVEVSSSMKLLALNEALNEMLSKEDYEQAAQIRDQIKALEEKGNRNKEGGGKDE